MQNLVHQRCFNHATREAVARCPECGRFFCRECITEHDDRVICASCLHRLGEEGKRAGKGFQWMAALGPAAGAALGAMVTWICFYMFGSYLLTLPSEFHSALWDHIAAEYRGY